MNKKNLYKLMMVSIAFISLIILAAVGISKIKVDDFRPASVIFILDSSASNQQNLPTQVKYLKQLCSILDPEDKIKIIKVSSKAYIIYEGSPFNYKEISSSIKKYTKYNPDEYGTAYKDAVSKALFYSKSMYKEGYIPAVVVLGDLEDEGDIKNKLSWVHLAEKIKVLQKTIPEFSIIFLYAHPEKLDVAKETLIPVLGEKKLIIASSEMIKKISPNILRAIGR